MPLKPLDFFILIHAAIEYRRLERELEEEHMREMAAKGYYHPDGSLNVEAILANLSPITFEEIRHEYEEDIASMAD